MFQICTQKTFPRCRFIAYLGVLWCENSRMRRLTQISAAVLLAACAGTASPESAIAPENVRASWDLSYRSDGPPIAVELGDLDATEDAWAEQQVEIFGAQKEYVVDLHLAETYQLAGSEMVSTEVEDDAIVRLNFGDTQTIRLSFPEELPPGTHIFELAIPVWINASEVVLDEPHDRVRIILTYTVQSPEERRAVAAFCEEAVPLSDGRTPTLDQLDELSRIAEAELDTDEYETLSDQVAALRMDLDAYLAGTGDGYSTLGMNEVIGGICNVNMLSESVIAD